LTLSIKERAPQNNKSLKIKTHVYSARPTEAQIQDIYYVEQVEILDRVGPLNTDITLVYSQFVGAFSAEVYNLVCYKDKEIGELKFVDYPCDRIRTSTKENAYQMGGFTAVYQQQQLDIALEQEDETIQSVHIFDAGGRLVHHYSAPAAKGTYRYTLPAAFPDGLFLITVLTNRNQYAGKKTFINGR
jgi:hypothetical protein